jgi:hypothetical protein
MEPIYNMSLSSDKAALRIQTAMRGHNASARNELGNRTNAAEQQLAKNTLSSAMRNRKARQEVATQKQQFNTY